jgi:hypothetical protein
VRWPGKSSGAFAYALTLLVLYLSRKKEQLSTSTKKQSPNDKPLNGNTYKDEWKTKEQNQNISCLTGLINDAADLRGFGIT